MAFGKRMIQDIDRKYGEAVSRLYIPDNFDNLSTSEKMVRGLGSIVGGSSPVFQRAQYPQRYHQVITPDGKSRRGERYTRDELKQSLRNSHITDAMLRTEAAAVRYGLPILGVTLAGKGLMDLTDRFRETPPAETQETLVYY